MNLQRANDAGQFVGEKMYDITYIISKSITKAGYIIFGGIGVFCLAIVIGILKRRNGK